VKRKSTYALVAKLLETTANLCYSTHEPALHPFGQLWLKSQNNDVQPASYPLPEYIHAQAGRAVISKGCLPIQATQERSASMNYQSVREVMAEHTS